VEMLSGGSTKITSSYFTPKLGGDMAAVRGMVKVLLARHQVSLEKGQGLFDQDFIAAHTEQVEQYLATVEQTSWAHIVEQSGLSQQQINQAASLYQSAQRVIFTWAMGITQHKHSVAMIQEFTNLQLLFGQLGKPGAGLCPVRGHSNVQGDRTMGINEKPETEFLQALENVFGFKAPAKAGHNTVQAIEAMLSGQSKIFIALGGNFAAATPDTAFTQQALANCRLTVNIATKLNRTHVTPGKLSLILPCLGRTDIDMQNGAPQRVTVEDSFSMVHASQGVVASNTANMRSEPAIIAGMAFATLGNEPIDWAAQIENYDHIRDLISATLAPFSDFNARIKHPGGFYLGNSAANRVWHTKSQKAQFMVNALPEHIIHASQRALTDNRIFVLQTLRSHDQYNTTIYGFEDRYRGLSGDRKLVMMHSDDMLDLALVEGEAVDIESLWPDQIERKVFGFRVVAYDIPKGNTAAYFPEANALVALASTGDFSDTPTSKSIAVVITKSTIKNQQII
jgi:molybdopterin-dependent oxidoreductase alpha subunit